MEQNPPGSGQQQQHQPPKYDPQHGGHYGMFPSSHIIILASQYWFLAWHMGNVTRVYASPVGNQQADVALLSQAQVPQYVTGTRFFQPDKPRLQGHANHHYR